VNFDDLQQEMLRLFESEAAGLLRQAGQALLELEASATADARAPLYTRLGRSLHTLKGTGATCGLMDVADVAHKMEDRLAPFVAGAAPLAPSEADLLLNCVDVLRGRIEAHVKGSGSKLLNASAALPELYGQAPDSAPGGRPEPVLAVDGPDAAALSPAVDPEGLSEASWKIDESQVLGLLRDVERLREHQISLRDRRAGMRLALTDLGAGRIEEARTRMGLLESALAHDVENSATLVELLEESLKAIHSLPTGGLAEPLGRALRDACRATGKQARLAFLGGEVAVDKRLIESLRGPLLHLVRNAVDHGIEPPGVRDAAGKHREGVVSIRFEQEGNLLLVEVADDGGGVDPEKLRQAALKRGLMPQAELSAMDEKALLELIFESGFSSKEDVTQLSGRGVGLDVVRSQVRALKGSVELHSRVGQGTRFTLTLPLEMGATPLMLVRTARHAFGLPVGGVESVVAVAKATLSPGPRPRLDFRGQWLGIADLGALMDLRPAAAPDPGQALLILQNGGRRLGLLVDAVDGDAELVVLPLPEELGLGPRSPYSGAGLYLGAELVLVLKSEWLLTRAADDPPPEP
jgi:chemotaxis protein histidine kinase CheA